MSFGAWVLGSVVHALLLPPCGICVFDLSGALELSHPKALVVASAIARAHDDGILRHAIDERAGHDPRAWAAIRGYAGRLAAESPAGAPAGHLRIVCVDSGRSFLFELADGRAAAVARNAVEALPDPNLTVVTGLAVIPELLSGRLRTDAAVEAELVHFDGTLAHGAQRSELAPGSATGTLPWLIAMGVILVGVGIVTRWGRAPAGSG